MPDDLARQQLDRPHRGEEDLHDAARLLLHDAHERPGEVLGEDDEDEDDAEQRRRLLRRAGLLARMDALDRPRLGLGHGGRLLRGQAGLGEGLLCSEGRGHGSHVPGPGGGVGVRDGVLHEDAPAAVHHHVEVAGAQRGAGRAQVRLVAPALRAVPRLLASFCSSASRAVEPATTPTLWRVVVPVWRVGMTTAAATTAKRMRVTTRNTRPRSRSRISRPATSPVSPSSLCRGVARVSPRAVTIAPALRRKPRRTTAPPRQRRG